MAGFSPRFCAIHLKIHVCPDASVTTKLKQQEDLIGYKIRRLHGQQTEEDRNADQEKFKRTNKEGTISALLAKAKATNAKQREDTGINDEDLDHGPLVTEDNINDRMAKLRNKALGITEPTPLAKTSPISNDDAPVTRAVKKTPKSSLNESIEQARSIQHEEKYGHIEKKSQLDDPIDHNDTTPIYSSSEVSKMIADAVELALGKFVNSSKKKQTTKVASKTPAKKTNAKPAAKAPVKKTSAKPATKTPAKKATSKPAAKAPVKKTTSKTPAKKTTIKAKKK